MLAIQTVALITATIKSRLFRIELQALNAAVLARNTPIAGSGAGPHPVMAVAAACISLELQGFYFPDAACAPTGRATCLEGQLRQGLGSYFGQFYLSHPTPAYNAFSCFVNEEMQQRFIAQKLITSSASK